ncbi:family 43 glycosylhydrolase [Rosenbergiella sp. S61]|uniref:Family 43 glycosylhydrolase n=1 Tax=Rosenbergiella gaditana TaxID=2726987 RepID=A0ABS5STS9_9GAMM|nr:glycoside hydrolase family 43 protein [Rosenbergiella gaditana]MBT0723491.1 family 43 glycosylhydrolase [Rosenbergiella gaditana]
MYKKLIYPIFFILFSCCCGADDSNINLKDENNNYINAHGGGILQYKNKYYWYGENRIKGNESGVSLYQSKDLKKWRYLGVIFKSNEIEPKSHSFFIERPKIVYNSSTNKFVMWFHVEEVSSNYKTAKVGVASSNDISGPYKFLYASRINARSHPINGNYVGSKLANKVNKDHSNIGQMSRDITIFKDRNDNAYLISSSEDNLTLSISLLSQDYTHTTGKYIRVQPGGYNEAPVMFFNEGKYYLVASGTTGWKPNRARLFTADKVFGYWKNIGDFVKGTDAKNINTTFQSQGSNYFEFNGDCYFMGDKWYPKDLSNSGYLFKKIIFSNDQSPYIK